MLHIGVVQAAAHLLHRATMPSAFAATVSAGSSASGLQSAIQPEPVPCLHDKRKRHRRLHAAGWPPWPCHHDWSPPQSCDGCHGQRLKQSHNSCCIQSLKQTRWSPFPLPCAARQVRSGRYHCARSISAIPSWTGTVLINALVGAWFSTTPITLTFALPDLAPVLVLP